MALTAFSWGLHMWGQELPLSSSLSPHSLLVPIWQECWSPARSKPCLDVAMDPLDWAPGPWTDFWAWLQTFPSLYDGPTCWALSDPGHLTRPYPDLWTDFPASNLTCLVTTNLPDNLDAWLNLTSRCCSDSHGTVLGFRPHSHAGLAEHFQGYLILICSCEVSMEIELL